VKLPCNAHHGQQVIILVHTFLPADSKSTFKSGAAPESGPVSVTWLSQTQLAQLAGVSRNTISSIETGRYSPSLELAFTISDFFGLPIEDIFIHERSGSHEKT